MILKASQGYENQISRNRTLKFLLKIEVHFCAETSRAEPGSTFNRAKGGGWGELRVAAFSQCHRCGGEAEAPATATHAVST